MRWGFAIVSKTAGERSDEAELGFDFAPDGSEHLTVQRFALRGTISGFIRQTWDRSRLRVEEFNPRLVAVAVQRQDRLLSQNQKGAYRMLI